MKPKASTYEIPSQDLMALRLALLCYPQSKGMVAIPATFRRVLGAMRSVRGRS